MSVYAADRFDGVEDGVHAAYAGGASLRAAAYCLQTVICRASNRHCHAVTTTAVREPSLNGC